MMWIRLMAGKTSAMSGGSSGVVRSVRQTVLSNEFTRIYAEVRTRAQAVH